MKFILPLFVLMFTLSAQGEGNKIGVRLPKGFEISEYAGSKLANNIYSMCIDPKGRIVVAGRGYIRILVDEDRDGRAERAIQFADSPKDGAMGLCWVKEKLYVTGDGGLREFWDSDGDDKADGPSKILRKMRTGGEHCAHAIVRGPDNHFYVLCGNHSGIDKSFVQLEVSPIKNPIAGCVVRFTPDFEKSEIIAHGFRNAYGMDFNPDGELFTYDSDNERCVSLPWYEHTRFYHVIRGGFYGWLSPEHADWWRCPPYFYDVVAPVTTLGRGSPTGVVCYRHAQFPKKYQGGMFALDWTFGKVYFLQLKRKGISYTCKKEVFLEAVGDSGFAPTAAVVHPETGDLFISIGGRGTRGAVYRIRYRKGPKEISVKAVEDLQPKKRPFKITLDFLTPNPVAHEWNEVRFTLLAALAPKRRVDAVRKIQLMLGGLVSPQAKGVVWAGYTPRVPMPQLQKKLGPKLLAGICGDLRNCFPSQQGTLDREISRTLAVLEDDSGDSLSKAATKLKGLDDPVEQIHYLIVLARLQAPRKLNHTKITTEALLGLEKRIREQGLTQDRHWPLRISELYRELSRRDPNLNQTMVQHPEFGEPAHALFAESPGFSSHKAARIFLEKAQKDPTFAWNSRVVRLIGKLPAQESAPVLRGLWGKAGLDSEILRFLSRNPKETDREKYRQQLRSPNLNNVRVALRAIRELQPEESKEELLSLMIALNRFPKKQAKDLQREIFGYLKAATMSDVRPNVESWNQWFAEQYPKLAKRLENPDGVDFTAWEKRLHDLKAMLAEGSSKRGKRIFTKANCALCHSGGQALGPDLRGVASRFSQKDLLISIIQPSRDVSSRYQVTLIETKDGKVYQGLVIYQAVDGVILQASATETIRIPGDQIVSQQRTPTSLMPTGLLDNLRNQEIADLYAYLKAMK